MKIGQKWTTNNLVKFLEMWRKQIQEYVGWSNLDDDAFDKVVEKIRKK